MHFVFGLSLRFPRCLALGLLFLVVPSSGFALISLGDVAASESESALQEALRRSGYAERFPYWKHVGQIERSTGVYLGAGQVLTAAHVGAGTFRTCDGGVYPAVPKSVRFFRNADGSRADLCLFRVQILEGDLLAKLPAIPLSTLPPRRGREVLLIGGGASWKREKSEKPGFPWGDDYRVRWGMNAIQEIYSAPMPTHDFESYGFATRFSSSRQCQAAPGDSGGAAFHYNPRESRWELAGVILAVDSEFGAANFGNQTYIADPVLFRRDLAAGQGGRPSIFAARP
jgi:hypothetical protein